MPPETPLRVTQPVTPPAALPGARAVLRVSAPDGPRVAWTGVGDVCAQVHTRVEGIPGLQPRVGLDCVGPPGVDVSTQVPADTAFLA